MSELHLTIFRMALIAEIVLSAPVLLFAAYLFVHSMVTGKW